MQLSLYCACIAEWMSQSEVKDKFLIEHYSIPMSAVDSLLISIEGFHVTS